MDENNISDFTRVAGFSTIDAAINPFRRQQQRRPSLMQCMDKDGNIDAFRYIEYSKQRRMEFLKRANFICTMKSTLQQQQRYPRSSSLPGVSTMMQQQQPLPTVVPPSLVTLPTSASTAAANTDDDMALWKAMEALRRSNSHNNLSLPKAVAARLVARSSSMPFISSFAMKANGVNSSTSNIRNNGIAATTASTTRNAEFPASSPNKSNNHMSGTVSGPSSPSQAPRRQLRKEEFEAAEALLFGMRRDCSSKSLQATSEDEKSDAGVSGKKRKLELQHTSTAECDGDAESSTVVSAEEETNASKQARRD